MSDICGEIAGGVLRDCTNKPVMGIEQDIVLVNVAHLLASGITFNSSTPNELIDTIALESGETGYHVDGLKGIMNFGVSFEIPADGESGVIHAINNMRIQNPSVAAQAFINEMVAGAKVFAIVESKWKGTSSANAFKFFGLKHGLVMTADSVWNSNENDGVAVLGLRTPEGFKEPYVPHQLLDTDYDTTRTAFVNGFPTA